jgi:3,5-dihydroxyphenylacetyl-CoA synthase
VAVEWGAGVPEPRIVGVGTANPKTVYRQDEVLDRYKIKDPRVVSLFTSGHVERRHLILPDVDDNGDPVDEAQGQLLVKHRTHGVGLAAEAIRACLDDVGAEVDDIDYLCCVSSTGFLTPGFSALLINEMGLRRDCHRADVVGMGCNAGLNGLNPVVHWARGNPGGLAVMVCVEVCSAAYVFDGTMRTAVVNSLFGDGAAAVAVTAGAGATTGPSVLKFASRIVPEAIDAMRYDWDDERARFSFYIDRDVPYVVGANAEKVLASLLANTPLRPVDIGHWIVHSGGKRVIDSVRVNLGLSVHDVRHTLSVLSDYGNLSSASFLFSYQRLVAEGRAASGDYGVFMTMGPGSTIEMALLRW